MSGDRVGEIEAARKDIAAARREAAAAQARLHVTREVSAADAAPIDATLSAAARSLGKDEPRSQEQRRSDLFADLLLSRLRFEESHTDDNADWLEIEEIDPDTGELLGTYWQRIGADGERIDDSPDAESGPAPAEWARLTPKQQRSLKIAIVVPLTSLLDLDDTPTELADRSASGYLPLFHLHRAGRSL